MKTPFASARIGLALVSLVMLDATGAAMAAGQGTPTTQSAKAPSADPAKTMRTELPAPAAALVGPSSGRLARPVVIKLSAAFPKIPVTIMKSDGNPTSQTTDVPLAAIESFARSVARRHFEDAGWVTETSAQKDASKSKAKGDDVREVVIDSVVVVSNPGPSYQVRVVVDRVQNGRRLGQATGQGFATPDRSTQRRNAAFAPGVFGLAASQKANQANAEKDHSAIEIAVVMALDSAMLQLAAHWANEQLVEDMQKKNNRR